MNGNDSTHHPDDTAQGSENNNDVVTRLRDSQIFREYQHAFQTATGLPLVLRAAGAFQEPMHGAKNINPFCALMAAKSKTCAACLQLQQQAENQAGSGPITLECFAGLNESLVPIRLGEKIVAYLQTGQVMLREPSEKLFRATTRQLTKWNADVEVASLRDAYFRSRVLARSHYEAMVRLLNTFAQHLSMVANELMIRASAVEPPAVAKARAYIAEHMGEPISLEQVAQSAHMSPFYFCKVFKAAVGLTFTDYLARARVEKTKQLLLNQHTRASEAAYEAGFQSLSQFNRVFRRIVGESPSSYRENLRGAVSISTPRNSYAFAA